MITEKELDSLLDFGEESEGEYSDRLEFTCRSVKPTHARGDGWVVHHN